MDGQRRVRPGAGTEHHTASLVAKDPLGPRHTQAASRRHKNTVAVAFQDPSSHLIAATSGPSRSGPGPGPGVGVVGGTRPGKSRAAGTASRVGAWHTGGTTMAGPRIRVRRAAPGGACSRPRCWTRSLSPEREQALRLSPAHARAI